MTASTDSQRRPVFVDRRNNRFFADPLIGNGAWPQVPLAVFYGSYAADPVSNPYGSQIAVGDLYFNTSANILRVWDGSLWQDAGGSNSSLFRWRKTAAGGETSLSGLDDGSTTLAYTPASEFLYLNGALLARGVDYVATTGTSITGLAALTASDVVELFSFNELNLANLNAGTVAFTQSGAGAVQRTVEGKLRDVISVKDFGAVGDGITDDTAAIQAAIDEAMKDGKQVLFQGPGPYCISSTLLVKVTRDLAPADITPASDIHFTDNTSALITGLGTPTLKATASMNAIMEIIFDTSDLDIGPFYSKVEGIGFDGNGLATSGLKSNYSMHLTIERNRFWNLDRGIEYTGYGVATILANTFKCINSLHFVNGGGDSNIISNDFYSQEGVAGACIYLGYYSGNIRIFGNTFTNEDGLATTKYAIQMLGTTAPGSEEVRDVAIRDNEFCGFSNAIRLDGKPSRNIYRAIISGNHTLPYGASNPGSLVAAVNCSELDIHSNFLNGTYLSSATSIGLDLVGCERCKITNNSFTKYTTTALSLTNCVGTVVGGNSFFDCAIGGTSSVVVALYGNSSARNHLRNNVFRQTSAAYGQLGISEDTGVDYTYSHDNYFDGFERPHTKVGANSVMRRTEYASSIPQSGLYYRGDIVWNTEPSAGGAPGWVCTQTGFNTFVFKAMANLAA